MSAEVLLSIRDLRVGFRTSRGIVRAVDGISLDINKGETLRLVGESGCGKTTLGRTILRLNNPSAGVMNYVTSEGIYDLAQLYGNELLPFRRRIQMIFQDPYSSLNPRMTTGDIIAERTVEYDFGTFAERSTEWWINRSEGRSVVILSELIIELHPSSCNLVQRVRSKVE